MTVQIVVITPETGSFCLVKAFNDLGVAESYVIDYLNSNFSYKASSYEEARNYLYDKFFEDATIYESEVF
jgi:hypothetical protein